MLLLTRHPDQKIVIGYGQQLWVTGPLGELAPIDPIEITMLEARGGKARLGVTADSRVSVHRDEVCQRIASEIAERHVTRAAG